jgi:hypothetical protein
MAEILQDDEVLKKLLTYCNLFIKFICYHLRDEIKEVSLAAV